MNDKVKLSQVSMIVTLGILLALITAYVPIFAVLSFLIPVPYAIIGTISNNKYSILSLIITFLILIFGVDITYAVSISIMSVLPGIVIGSIARKNIKEGQENKFEPIYAGTIIVIISTIIFYTIANVVFKTNLLDNFMNGMKEAVSVQLQILGDAGVDVSSRFKVEDVITFAQNLLPAMLFLQGIVLAFVTYYIEVFILKRIRMVNLEMPKFRDFYLPGNPVMVSLMLYILVFLIDMLGLNFHGDLIIMNLQLVFNFMFMAQGIAVSVYYLRNWFKASQIKNIFISGLILYIFGFMGISFLGMLDSVIDFRKVRSYKSA